uniref:Capsular polysaccharide ABC transporter n=1 Tax=Rubrivivax gelatinosus S1 TaxID=1138313 RepID=L8BAN5_RUBGE|nr:Capsular polysaccharide ABC transporter [Rubrivivax gelatinosus S1]
MNRLLSLTPRTLKIAIIAAPFLLFALYFAAVASDRYVSESVVTVRQAGSNASSAIPGAALLLAGINPPAHEDTMHLREFVHSQALALQLDQKLKLREHFSRIRIDPMHRLPADSTIEDYVRYFRDHVEVQYDERTALLKVRTQGLDPEFAQRFNTAVLEASERFVNETSHRIAREQLQFAETELQLAGRRVQDAANAVLTFQSKNKLLDPTVQAQATGALTVELEGMRARLEAELGGLRGFLNEDAYQVQALKSRIAALDRQIDSERKRATDADAKGTRLNKQALDFQALQLQAEFARDAYKLALAAVENARIDATRKIKSLVVIEPPSRPQTAEYPHVGYDLTTVLAASLLLYAIARLVLATIREHHD